MHGAAVDAKVWARGEKRSNSKVGWSVASNQMLLLQLRVCCGLSGRVLGHALPDVVLSGRPLLRQPAAGMQQRLVVSIARHLLCFAGQGCAALHVGRSHVIPPRIYRTCPGAGPR